MKAREELYVIVRASGCDFDPSDVERWLNGMPGERDAVLEKYNDRPRGGEGGRRW
jgi:hypothetical protein